MKPSVILLWLLICTCCFSSAFAEPGKRRTVRIAAFNYYPTIFQAEDGSVQGIGVDFLEEIAKEQKWDIEFVFGSWSDGLSRIKNGQVDVLCNVAFTNDRALFMDYGTVPFVTVWAELYVPNNSDIDNILGVQDKTIALMKDDYNGANFRNMVEKFSIACQFVELDDSEEVLEAISTHQVDGGVVNNAFGAAKQGDFEDIKSSGVIFNPFDIYFTTAKGKHQDIIQTLDKYLGQWRKEESSPYHQAMEKWSHGNASTIKVTPSWFRGALFLVIIILSVAAVFIITLRIQVGRKTSLLLGEMEKSELIAKELRQATGQLEKELAERILAEEAISQSEEKFSKSFENAPVMMSIIRISDGIFLNVNKLFIEKTGFTRQELVGKTANDLGLITPELRRQLFAEITEKGRFSGSDTIFPVKNGKNLSCLYYADRVQVSGQMCLIFLALDITEQRDMEEQLRQSQKMESMGRLAGGVAHDFNNMLSIILGYAELWMSETPESEDLWQDLNQISKAAQRSRDLTRQLLAFSRKEVIAPQALNLNSQIIDAQKNLGRLIGEDIQLSFKPATGLWQVKMDPSQLDQILMNLSVNSRDAMDDGGIISLETANIQIGENHGLFHANAQPGDYVQLNISDNGCGIDSTLQKHIFEPFFTTKEMGQGTGLGLATVHGIVTQNGGFINLYSEPGIGTTFKIFLPRLLEESAVEEIRTMVAPTGTGTILLVEDEEMLLVVTTKLLEKMGYQVIQAPSPRVAISICKKGEQHYDLVLTDVIMPKMNGREMADRILALRPESKVLFMSGYSADVVAQRGVVDDGMHYIVKPLEMNQLNEKIKEAMGQK